MQKLICEKDPCRTKTANNLRLKQWKLNHIFLCYTSKAHVNLLHVQTPLRPLYFCFRSHLQEFTFSYFKLQAVSSWHFEHKAIMVKYFQLFLLHCIFLSPQTMCTLSSLSLSQHPLLNLSSGFIPLFVLPLPQYPLSITSPFHSFIYFCHKHEGNLSQSLSSMR